MTLPESNDQHLWVSWDDYHKCIEKLCLQVYESGWEFNQILCLARGGVRPGDIMSRVFNVPLAILSTSSYRADAGTVQGDLDIASHITNTGAGLSGPLLLVDDLLDSGETVRRVLEHIKTQFTDVTEVRVAVLWHKACSSVSPDYAVEYLPKNPWIHQPFEIYDTIRPDQLMKRLQTHQ